MEKPQSKKRIFIPLTLKLVIVVVASLVSVLLIYELMEALEKTVAKKYYLSEEAQARTINEAYRDLKSNIDSQGLKSTDTDKLQNWIKSHDYTYLRVEDNFRIAFDGGWSVNAITAEEETEESQTSQMNSEAMRRITPETYDQDLKNRILTFADGDFYVFIDSYREQNLYRIFDVAEVTVGVGVVIGALLVYNARVMRRIRKVSQYAENVTNGDLGATIKASANDEVGRLATSVDTMRSSLIQRLINEKEAWDKNSELITAMSHDIRTPLTSLIGYLDIIESGKYQSEEEAMKYVAASRDKAFQLKDLSDKLFQYFLVFGSKASDKHLEIYDAGILVQQLLSEHVAELMTHGFTVDFSYNIEEGIEIEADVSGLKRLFDNIFSNVMKYATKEAPIEVSGDYKDEKIFVHLKNGVREDSRNVESNKIGLKTCEKICKDMGGDFVYEDEGETFTVNLNLPAYREKTVEEKVSEEGLAGINVHDIDLESLAETIAEPATSAEAIAQETDTATENPHDEEAYKKEAEAVHTENREAENSEEA